MKKIMLVIVVLAIALLILLLIRLGGNRSINQIWRTLQSQPSNTVFSSAMVTNLPEAVQRYFLNAIAPGTPLANSVQLQISGSFKPKPNGEWLPMTAKQIISTSGGFVWKAAVKKGWMNFSGADYYFQGRGKMQFFFWGLLPLVNAQNDNIARSAEGRLGGEYIFLPSALLPHNGVDWRQIDANTIEASFKIDREPITLSLTIDREGKLLELALPRWGDKTENGSWDYIPFNAIIEAETTFGGYTIPTKMVAGWNFGTKQEYKFYQPTIQKAGFN